MAGGASYPLHTCTAPLPASVAGEALHTCAPRGARNFAHSAYGTHGGRGASFLSTYRGRREGGRGTPVPTGRRVGRETLRAAGGRALLTKKSRSPSHRLAARSQDSLQTCRTAARNPNNGACTEGPVGFEAAAQRTWPVRGLRSIWSVLGSVDASARSVRTRGENRQHCRRKNVKV